MGKVMVIGVPNNRDDDDFVYDDNGKVVGKKNQVITYVNEPEIEVQRRKEYHDAKMEQERRFGYRDRRKEKYPEIGEQLDAVWKQLKVMNEQGIELIPEAKEMLGKISQVKSDEKKPSE